MALLLRAATLPAADFEEGSDALHFSYARYFGSGVYRAESGTVTVYQIPLAFEVIEAGPPARRSWWLRLPITAGFASFRFEDVPEIPDLREDARTLSVVPGLEVEVPIGPRWRVVPFADLGAAIDLDADNAVGVFGLGVRSYYGFPVGRWGLTIGNRTLYAGHEALDDFPADRFGAFETGIESVLPFRFRLLGRESDLALHYVNYLYFNRLAFVSPDEGTQKVGVQNEIGLSFGTPRLAETRAFDIPRIGLAYRDGEAGRGVRLVLGLPF